MAFGRPNGEGDGTVRSTRDISPDHTRSRSNISPSKIPFVLLKPNKFSSGLMRGPLLRHDAYPTLRLAGLHEGTCGLSCASQNPVTRKDMSQAREQIDRICSPRYLRS